MTAGDTARGWCGIPLLAALLLAVGCDRNNDGPHVDLDSAGAKIERGVDKVGKELDTAFTGIKTELNESQIEGALHRMRGMEDVEVELSPDGSVRLSGMVPTRDASRLAEEVVTNINGVTSVRNDLTIGTVSDTMRLDTVAPDSLRR